MKITQILVESQSSLDQVGMDMKKIYQEAVPKELRNRETLECDNIRKHEYFFDLIISVQEIEFRVHEVRRQEIKLNTLNFNPKISGPLSNPERLLSSFDSGSFSRILQYRLQEDYTEQHPSRHFLCYSLPCLLQ